MKVIIIPIYGEDSAEFNIESCDFKKNQFLKGFIAKSTKSWIVFFGIFPH